MYVYTYMYILIGHLSLPSYWINVHVHCQSLCNGWIVLFINAVLYALSFRDKYSDGEWVQDKATDIWSREYKAGGAGKYTVLNKALPDN